MRGRRLVALMLVAATFAAMAASADINPRINEEPTGLKLSKCYDCHKDGGGSLGPAMVDTHLVITPEETIVPLGEKTEFVVSVQNAWTAEVDRIVAAVDVTETPALAHASSRAAIEDTVTGVVPVDPSQVGGIQDEFTERVTFDIEGGITDLTLTLYPDGGQPELHPQFTLRLFPPSKDPSKNVDPELEFTAPEKGAPVVFTATGASNIVGLGIGTWIAEIVVEDVFSAQDPSGLVDQPFAIDVLQEFKESADPVAYSGTDAVLPDSRDGPGVQAHAPFTLTLLEMPSEPTTLDIAVTARHFFDHPPSASQDDQWMFIKTIQLVVIPMPEDNAVMIQGSGVVAAPPLIDGIAWDRIGEVIGYISGFLVLASIYTGGMFGKTSRRQLNSVFGTAKRRVAFHNFLSYGILLSAVAHTIMFIFVESAFGWTRGIIWGGVAIAAMIGLGVTGSMQVPMIRKWNYATWRWSHFYLAIATMVFTVVHILLDGQNFGDLQTAIGWTDPFA